MGVTLSGSAPADPSRPKGILELIQEGIAGVGGIGPLLAQGLSGLVVGTVGLVVGAVQGVIGLIGSLFSAGRRDTAAVDQARVAAENAIVDNLGDAIDQLDEIQRAGGAYMDYKMFHLSGGGLTPHVLPLSAPMTLQEGTRWVEPFSPLSHSHGHTYANNEGSYSSMATGSGYLELMEPGFWRIDFQSAVLQGADYYAAPAEVWCYVTPASHEYVPCGAPGLDEAGNPVTGVYDTVARSMYTGQKYPVRSDRFAAFGRSASYVDQLETRWSGGNTIAGTVFALIPSGGYKVTMACAAWKHFSGGASTFVMATKINSESLRDSIEDLKTQFANSLPGQSTALEMTDAEIAAMVAQAQDIDVVIPDE